MNDKEKTSVIDPKKKMEFELAKMMLKKGQETSIGEIIEFVYNYQNEEFIKFLDGLHQLSSELSVQAIIKSKIEELEERK